ncbi:hypothetical protein GTCCBUS3UF5_9390 [Geobacillus thermoleovorans CCB_US3_UF5]|uniref:Uncharacterized protein n=1 Tax=Geobacillus thermoleovorans CCB_US3_UF5 TaxID=1111068 RepID=A0ABM5MEV3_GEOTH|nr:hypothetical protein GTCCBUS3UF5_9390 [Geobacillus thermoleovorans CCB_US3_UF5]
MVKNENGLQIDGISSEKKADSAAFFELKESRNQPYFALNHQPFRDSGQIALLGCFWRTSFL